MAIQQSALCGAGLVYATCRYMPLPELDHALPYLSPSTFFGVKGLLLHPRGLQTAPELIALLCSASRLAARLGATCDHVSSVIVTSQQTAPCLVLPAVLLPANHPSSKLPLDVAPPTTLALVPSTFQRYYCQVPLHPKEGCAREYSSVMRAATGWHRLCPCLCASDQLVVGFGRSYP